MIEIYPVLFEYGSLRIDTYSVVWFVALMLAISWALRRLRIYGIDEDEARSVMAWSFVFMLLGARAPEYFQNFRVYMSNPKLFLDLNRGSLHEIGAILGAVLSALIMCVVKNLRGKNISFVRMCDVAIIPAFAAIAIGRWGCFLNGCCFGLVSSSFFAVHFPFDSVDVTRHPTQIYYSLFACVNVLILLLVERKLLAGKNSRSVSIIAPLGILLYCLMRFVIGFFRVMNPFYTSFAHVAICSGTFISVIWLGISLRKFSGKVGAK